MAVVLESARVEKGADAPRPRLETNFFEDNWDIGWRKPKDRYLHIVIYTHGRQFR